MKYIHLLLSNLIGQNLQAIMMVQLSLIFSFHVLQSQEITYRILVMKLSVCNLTRNQSQWSKLIRHLRR